MSDTNPGELAPGDLCTASYNNVGDGMVYRVLSVDDNRVVELEPLTGVLTRVARRRTRRLGMGWCARLSAGDLRAAAAELESLAASLPPSAP